MARLDLSASGSPELWLQRDPHGRLGATTNQRIQFGLTLKGKGPGYHEFEVRLHGSGKTAPLHQGTVTIDPKQEWVVIDLQEVISKLGEPVRTEPCSANGRYRILTVTTGANIPGTIPGSGPTAGELAVPAVPNAPYVQAK